MDEESPIRSLIDSEPDSKIKQRIWEAYMIGCVEGIKVMEDKKRNVSHQDGNVVYLRPLNNKP